MKLKIGFLGAGRMASALAQGFIRAGLTEPALITASDPLAPAREAFAAALGAKATSSNFEVLKKSDVIFLAVKPNHVTKVLEEISGSFLDHHLLISIAAGIPLAKLEAPLPPAARVVRVMPNTPALIGASATAFALGKAATPEDGKLVETLFSAVGVAVEVKESLLDAVTGLSGSGPAYGYLFIEAMSDGGVAAGLPREVATRLAAQTLLGSARMVLETGQHPGALKDMVASPGGTTIEGLHELERSGVRGAIMDAVRAAADKSHKLGHG